MNPDLIAGAAPYLRAGRERQLRGSPRAGILSWYQTIALAITLGVLFSNLPIYAYVLSPGLLPKFFFIGLFALLAPLLLFRLRALGAYLISPFALWALVMIILNIIHLSSFSTGGGISAVSLIDNQVDSRNALILTRIQYIAFAVILGFAVYSSDKISYLRIFVFLAFLLPCTVILDFINPGLLYPLDAQGAVLGRAAAMFINPTMAAGTEP